jgi:uncharacterized protein (TIGR04141 family)
VDSVADLASLSQAVFAKARDDSYRIGFGWVDNFSLVTEEELVASLRAKLAEDVLASPTPASVDVLIADDLAGSNDGRTIGYILLPRERRSAAKRLTLPIGQINGILEREGVNGLDQELRFIDDSGELIGAATIQESLCADLEVAGEQFVASDGNFYRVDVDFVTRINAQVSNISASEIALPCYDGEPEGDYNTRAAAESDDLILLDRRLVVLPGESQVEACDLLHASGALIHVKRKGKSGPLSHLFFQAANSCQLLRRSAEFRAQFGDLARSAANVEVGRRRQVPDFGSLASGPGPEVVFAILGLWRNKTALNLPLFSRIALVDAVRSIGQMGFDVRLNLVDVCE